MNILVCIKQVPDMESPFEIDDEIQWIRESKKISYRMNRYDEYALEEAVLIKESHDNVSIDVLTIGPCRAETAVKKSLEKGADNGYHLLYTAPYIPPLAIAHCIAGFASKKDYDLIFTGVMSEDAMHSQVGPAAAALLNIPCADTVVKQRIDLQSQKIAVECELEGGIHEKITLSLPALLTIQSGINRPRYPSLSNVLRAKKSEINTMKMEDLPGCTISPLPRELSFPVKEMTGIVLTGSSEEKAEKLLSILHESSIM